MLIKWKRLSQKALLPKYQSKGASGFDLHAIETYTIMPGKVMAIDTGWMVEVPDGYEIQIRPRSGLAMKHGITVINSPGTIDSDFRGELKVLLYNAGNKPYQIKKRDRIAQGIITKVFRADFQVVDSLSDSERDEGGFGSTGLS